MPCMKQVASSGLNRFALRQLTLLPAALFLAACATSEPPAGAQRATEPVRQAVAPKPAAPVALSAEQEALRTLISYQDRLYRIAAPLLVRNADLCRASARNLLGFTAKNRYSYSSEFVGAAQSFLGLDDRLRVAGVLAGSGAAKIGLRPGDILLSVEDKALPQGEKAEREAAVLLAPLVTGRSIVRVNVLREGAQVPLTVPLTYACAYGIELGNVDNVMAYADGRRVLITRGMMNAVQSDEELAFVIAKEMAHNMLAHAARLRMSATVGGIIDNLIRVHPDTSTMSGLSGVRPMPQELDAMADKLSLYLLARAGYRIDGAGAFWKIMGTRYPVTVLNAYTALHPATDYRVAAIEKTIREVKAKQAGKRPLMP